MKASLALIIILSFAVSASASTTSDSTVKNLFKAAAKGKLKKARSLMTGDALRIFGTPEGVETIKNSQAQFSQLQIESTLAPGDFSGNGSGKNKRSYVVDVSGLSGQYYVPVAQAHLNCDTKVSGDDQSCSTWGRSRGCGEHDGEIVDVKCLIDVLSFVR